MKPYSPHLLSLLLLSLFMLAGCNVPPYDAQKVQSILEQQTSPTNHVVRAQGREMRFVAVGHDPENEEKTTSERPLIIFVHGAPGDFNAFSQYLADADLRGAADMISVDRLGYSGSQPGQAEPVIEVQAAVLHEAIKLYPKSRPRIFVGHSYGGPVIARYSIDYPDYAEHLVMLAPAVDPATHKKRWYQIVADNPPVKWVLPTPLRVTTTEMIPLNGELVKMEPLWDKISADITVIQGGKDWLVPPGHAAFVKEKHPDAEIIMLEEEGHFIPWEQYDLVKETLLKAASKNAP